MVRNKIQEDESVTADQLDGTFLAFKEKDAQALQALLAKKVDTSLLKNSRDIVRKIPGAIMSADVKFFGKTTPVKAMFIPISAISANIVQRIKDLALDSSTGNVRMFWSLRKTLNRTKYEMWRLV